MPRTFDPDKTDPSIRVIEGVRSFLYAAEHKLSMPQLNLAIKNFLRLPQYTNMFKEYFERDCDFPEIQLSNHCRKGRYYLDSANFPNKYFKAKYQKESNTLLVCQNLIYDLVELKENIDRELVMAYDHNIRRVNLENDEQFACSQIHACQAQMMIFEQHLNPEAQQIMMKICARFLIRHRAPNEQKLPYDSWVRYSEKMLDKFQYCALFNEPFPYQQK